MSDLLVIVPPGWIQLDWEYISNNVTGLDTGSVNNLLAAGITSDIEAALKSSGQIPEESSLQEAKLLDNTYFLVRLG